MPGAASGRVTVEKVRKGGFAATYVRVEAPEEHGHRFLPQVEEIFRRGSLAPRQCELALRDESDLKTESAGEAGGRCVVVYPKDYQGKPVEPRAPSFSRRR